MGKYIKLLNGQSMPIFGLGTWQSKPQEVKIAVRTALDAGYRMIDTAYNYLNEDTIGEVLEEYIKGSKIKREDIFVTTKLPGIYTRPSDVKHSMSESLRKLRLDYVDLFLIHTPMEFQNTGDPSNIIPMVDGKLLKDDTVDICEVWKAMEELVDDRKAKSIGLSNFNSKQTDKICKIARIPPVVSQVECHAYFPQYKLHQYCAERGIIITAYSPFGCPTRHAGGLNVDQTTPSLLEHAKVKCLAKKYKKTSAQILLRNLIQRGMIVIPKSVTPSRIQSNIQVFDFELTDDDMAVITSINIQKRLFHFGMWKDFKGYPFNIPY